MMRIIDAGKPSAKCKRKIHSLTLDFIPPSIDDTTAVFRNYMTERLAETVARRERLFFSVAGNLQQVSNVPLPEQGGPWKRSGKTSSLQSG